MTKFLYALIAVFFPVSPLTAQTTQISPNRLDLLDERGYFTPAIKAAVHDLVDARQALARAKANQRNFEEELPNLQKESADADAQTARLQTELMLYTHPENADYLALTAAMKNPAATPRERAALAQAFVWSYPNDPRQSEAENDLHQIQSQLEAARKSVADADAARTAARETLVKQARAGELSLTDWQDFLRDMSQEELLHYLGPPGTRQSEYWIYPGNWITDRLTKRRAGLQINFNGTRVVGVTAITSH